MDDDELPTRGLSGWAGYQLGRMAAEDRDPIGGDAWPLFRRRNGIDRSSNPATLLAQNQALAKENAQLRADLEAYRFNYNNLKAWADRAEQRIEELKKGAG